LNPKVFFWTPNDFVRPPECEDDVEEIWKKSLKEELSNVEGFLLYSFGY